jgi:hypothetical protein
MTGISNGRVSWSICGNLEKEGAVKAALRMVNPD